jgi:hypothetical protein
LLMESWTLTTALQSAKLVTFSPLVTACMSHWTNQKDEIVTQRAKSTGTCTK